MRAVIVAIVLAAPPGTSAPGISGIWDGTIGRHPVRVCFDDHGGLGAQGMYFYRHRLVTIPLAPAGQEGFRFSEGWPDDPTSPRWALKRAGSVLQGTWTQGALTLPIRLNAISVAENGPPCATLAFQQPRLEGLRTIRSTARKDGVSYVKLSLDHRGHFPAVSLESFELPGDGPAIRSINAMLAKPFQDKGWLECIQSAGPWGGSMNESLEPRLISRRWLVINHQWGGFCGGAHPNSFNDARTFDLTTGREIDLRDWFGGKAFKTVHYEGEEEVSKHIQPSFRQLVIGGWKADEECADTVDTAQWWDLELTRTGVAFTPALAHAAQACEKSFTVPFARLMAYLTPEGRRNIASLEAETKAKR